ncbi:MAG: DegV family protein [bacterium]|nr:DegV family protein [bacterium]
MPPGRRGRLRPSGRDIPRRKQRWWTAVSRTITTWWRWSEKYDLGGEITLASFNVVTDSTADLSPEERQCYDISVVPLKVQFGLEGFRDMENLDQEGWREHFARGAWPTTSQPSIADFIACYSVLEGPVLSVHLSARLSGTARTADASATSTLLRETRVIDSGMASAALAYQVMAAGEIAAAGGTLDQAERALADIRRRTRINFMVDSLDYLQKGGRIGLAQAWLGVKLQIKPILHLEDGIIQTKERVRTRKQALARLVKSALTDGVPEKACVVHFLGAEAAAELCEVFKSETGLDPETRQVSCVLGTHIGPGTVGLISVAPENSHQE